MKKMIALVAMAGAASLAHADYTFSAFDLFDVSQNNTFNNSGARALIGAPASFYTGVRVNFNWDSNPNGTSNNHAWSNEARIQLASASGTGTGPTYPGGTIQHSSVLTATNGAGNATDVASLSFTGVFGTAYAGGAAPLFFNYRQTFSSTINDVDWRGVTVTLIEAVRPNCINLGNIAGPNLNFNTEGSLLSGTNDTEIAVWDNNGAFLGTDDDGGTGNLSSLSLAGLTNGTYYIAVGAFNSTFGAGWSATSTSIETGTTVVNVTNGTDTLTGGGALAAGGIQWYCITIPTPSAAALLGMGGLMAARRRRA